MKFDINQKVTVVATNSAALDGAKATVFGYYGQGYVIILFYGTPPVGYDPAIVLSEHCLKVIA